RHCYPPPYTLFSKPDPFLLSDDLQWHCHCPSHPQEARGHAVPPSLIPSPEGKEGDQENEEQKLEYRKPVTTKSALEKFREKKECRIAALS
ncbi:MAG: hypothetical protein ACUVWS_09850, partial [Roseiflexus sp.]